jgi:StAR-related lipid transfer protein 7, mitochondrial
MSQLFRNNSILLNRTSNHMKCLFNNGAIIQRQYSYFFKNFSSISNPILENLRQKLVNHLNILLNFKKSFIQKTNLFKKVRIPIIESKKLYALALTAGLFTWDEHGVTNNEVKNEINQVLTAFKITNNESKQIDFEKSRHFQDSEWEKIFDKKDLIIWRRKIFIDDEYETTNSDDNGQSLELYEYKVLGRIMDVTPIEFYETQIDLKFRKQWDYLVISIEMIDKDSISNTELIRWYTKFPYPLYPREYIFVRRYCIEPTEKLLILISRGVPECDLSSLLPKNKKATESVRVTKYKSNMIIIPHNDFEKPGLDYVMQYYDVNKANIPKMAYKWMASSGLPDYIEKLHKATLQLKKMNQKLNHTNKKENILSKFELFNLIEEEKNDETNDHIHEENTQNNNEQMNEKITNDSDKEAKIEQN